MMRYVKHRQYGNTFLIAYNKTSHRVHSRARMRILHHADETSTSSLYHVPGMYTFNLFV